jgi:hypothetical protein
LWRLNSSGHEFDAHGLRAVGNGFRELKVARLRNVEAVLFAERSR